MSSLIRRDLQLKRQRRDRRKADQPERYLAKIVRLSGNMKVPNRPGYVYVQQLPDDDAPPPVPVLCVAVQPRVNMRVWVEKNREGEWECVTWWKGIVAQPGYQGYAYLPLHGRDHEWPDKAPRPDAVNIYPRAWVPLRAYPGEAGGLTISVVSHRYIHNGIITFFPGQHSLDVSASQPAVGLARYVGIYLDVATNAIGTVDGATTLDAPAIEPDMPAFPAGAIPSAAVRLDGDATTFTERDFLDLRMIVGEASTGGGGELARIVVFEGNVVTFEDEVIWI
jgi:hypothetical protein